MPDIREQFVALGLAAHQEEKKVLAKQQKLCSVCKESMHETLIEKHLKEKHGIFKTPSPIVQCPKCDVAVSKKNLEKHIRKAHEKKAAGNICHICGKNITVGMKHHKKTAHPARQPKFAAPQPRVQPKTLSPHEASSRRKELQDQKLIQNKAVRDFLNRVPEKPKYGKFGLPQDKYRWGFYGSSSMEYDLWGKS